MRFRGVIAALTGLGMLIGPLAATAHAGGSGAPATAGGSVDLRQGWGKYQACLQRPDGGVECFANQAEMKKRSDRLAPSAGPKTASSVSAQSSSTWCPVFLYSGANYSGQTLEITSRGYWLNLSDFGFDNRTVSFIGYSCGFHLADYNWGGGWWYPGNTGPWAYAPNMGSWNYRVSSVYIY